MGVKLYVGNISYSTTEDELRELFVKAGNVVSVAVVKDRDTGSSRGFAFVEMGNQSEAENAISMFNGYRFNERELRVNPARPREERPSFGDRGDRGGGGGFRGDRRDRDRNRGGGRDRY